ncbi:MAG: PEP-CTERM sorting domain-containing protein, partial [Alphaproteobacteria bacterium]
TVSKGTSITSVHQLLQQFASNERSAAPYFAVDGCVWNPTRHACGRTGLFVVTRIPEPASSAMLASGLLLLGWLRWKRVI